MSMKRTFRSYPTFSGALILLGLAVYSIAAGLAELRQSDVPMTPEAVFTYVRNDLPSNQLFIGTLFAVLALVTVGWWVFRILTGQAQLRTARKSKKTIKTTTKVKEYGCGALLLLIISVIALSIGFNQSRQSRKIQTAAVVEGTIVAHAVSISTGEEGELQYEFSVQYEYMVNNQAYSGEQVVASKRAPKGGEIDLQQVEHLYQVGEQLQLAYEPDYPEGAQIVNLPAKIDWGVVNWWPFIIGLIAGIGGIITLIRVAVAVSSGQIQGGPLKNVVRGPVGFEIELERPDGPYYPGDIINGTLILSSEKNVNLRRLSLGLALWEHYCIPFGTDDAGNTQYREADYEDFVVQETILTDGRLPAGIPQHYQFRLSIPRGISPAYAQDINKLTAKNFPADNRLAEMFLAYAATQRHLQHSWLVKIILERQGKVDLHHQINLPLVVPPPAKQIKAGKYGESSHPEQVRMSIYLPRLEWLEGERLQGKLLVRPHTDMQIRQVRLELVKKEQIQLDGYRSEETEVVETILLADNVTYEPNQETAHPFEIALPCLGMPTLCMKHATVTWILKGVLDRRLKKDCAVEVKIFVYTSDEWEGEHVYCSGGTQVHRVEV
jgi:sporulation-control protein spo0M